MRGHVRKSANADQKGAYADQEVSHPKQVLLLSSALTTSM